MFIVKISDGLGNQMFQYAYARALKEKTGAEVYLDTSDIDSLRYGRFPYHVKYGLDKYEIELPIAKYEEIQRFFSSRHKTLFSQFCREFRLTYKLRLMEGIDREVIDMNFRKGHDYYIFGGFFNRKYMDSISEILRKELQLKTFPKLPDDIFDAYQNNITVSLHMRGENFYSIVGKKKINRDIRNTDYYAKSIDYARKHIKSPFFLVFSDNIEWVKENCRFDEKFLYVSGRGFSACEEMYLMSKCNHNIIANSTFSFWGAWLNENKDKIMIAPRGWRRSIISDDDWVLL